MSVAHHCLPPGGDFVPACARLLLAQDAGPDLTAWRVVVPNLMIAPDFKRALADAAGRKLLLPPVETLQVHLSRWVQHHGALSDHRRQFALYYQLCARRWFDQGNLWALCAEFIALFDELTEHGARLPDDLDALAAQLAAAYQAREGSALRFEASVVHQLWFAESAGPPSLTAARLLAAAAWTRSAPNPLLVIAEGPLPAPWQGWLAAHAERAPVIVCEADRQCSADPVLALLGAAWPAAADDALKTRAADLPEDAAAALRLQLCVADSLEQEAHAVAAAVRQALREGAHSIAMVAVDRMTARRARALLERDAILVEDESGWKLSTTRAAALLDAILEVFARDAYHRDLIDLCKSPFVFGDLPADARQDAVLALERAINEAELIGGLDALAALPIDNEHAPSLIARLRAGKVVFALTAAPPQRWFQRLLDALNALGACDPLRADAAGQVLLEWIDARIDELAGEACMLDFDEWRAWLEARLDEALFRDRSIRSPVVMTHLPACRLRGFDLAIVIGADSAQLCASDVRPVFVHEGVRQELGLPGMVSARERLRDDLAGLVAACGRVMFTWQKDKAGEPCQLAADLDLLDLAHTLRFGVSLVSPAAPVPMPPVTAAGQRVPAPVLPPGLRPTQVSASGYSALVGCPYQYFIRFVLGLDEAATVSETMEKQHYGALVHTVLEQFHARYPVISGHDPAELLAALEAISQAVFAARLAANFMEHAWLLRWRQQWSAYLDWQRAREAAGWRYQAGERDLRRALALADGAPLTLRGRIDRLDVRSDGALAVLDYKTRDRSALAKAVNDPEDIQLAVYAALAGAAVSEAGYVSLDGERTETLAVADPAAAVAAQLARLVSLFEQLGAGVPLVANGVSPVCDGCVARGACRKDYHDG
ncbi:MAG: PD-(D/E)XK nuclease family protein [Rhodocyclaceae bacterium]|nr:PD-(D/E)XK nuclease family protein [Rhodocyclaceae bacterium]